MKFGVVGREERCAGIADAQILRAEHDLSAALVRLQVQVELWRPTARRLKSLNVRVRFGHPPVVVRDIQFVRDLQPLFARNGLQTAGFDRL